MTQNIFKIIFFGYVYMLLITSILLKNQINTSILLQNTIYFFIISFIIFFYFKKLNEKQFSYASLITYARCIINILIFSIIINSEIYTSLIINNNEKNLLLFLLIISVGLDGLDGYIARYFKESSLFGYKFDLETDTLLILILSISVYLNIHGNLIVLLIPFYRYVFFALQFKYQWLKNNLPESYRRKLICLLVISILIICHIPKIPIYMIMPFIYLSIFLITFSFLKDIIWLYKNKFLLSKK